MANITDVEFTTSGYIEVFAPDGSYVSRHRLLDEARESALNHAIQHLSKDPEGIDEPYTESFEYTFVSPGTRMSISILQGIGGRTAAGDIDPPLAPVGVFLSNQTDNTIQINWTTNSEPDIRDYRVYKSTTSADAGFSPLQIVLTPGNSYVDTTFLSTEDTWYKVTARDSALNESEFSATVAYSAPVAPVGDNAVRIAALTSGHTIPFAYSTPSDPITDSTSSPSSISAIQSAITVSGSTVTIAPGTYSGNLTLVTSDVDVIANGVTLNGNLTIGQSGSGARPSRIRWTGGTVNGIFEFEKGTDFLVDNLHNVNSSGGGTPVNWTGGPGDGVNYNRERFAVINSTIEIVGADSSGGWAIFMFAPASGPRPDGIGHTDWIMGNVIINSNAQNFRVGEFIRGVFIDTYWNSDNGSTNGPRFENYIEDCYIGDSIAVGSTITNSGQNNDFTIENWRRYHSLNNIFSNMFNSGDTGSTVNNSPFGDSGGGPFGGEIPLGAATGSNNLSFAWDGSTLPDDSAYGADH